MTKHLPYADLNALRLLCCSSTKSLVVQGFRAQNAARHITGVYICCAGEDRVSNDDLDEIVSR
jgi:hypothetical protein